MKYSHTEITKLLQMSLPDIEFQIQKDIAPPCLSNFEVYIALIKGYCITLVLFLPGAFVMAGPIVSPLLMLASAVITTICVAKLVAVGNFY
jgi:hypothetical protein